MDARLTIDPDLQSATLNADFPRVARKPGGGFLQFTRHKNGTVLQRRYAMNPLKLLQPRNHGCGAWVYASTYGGGLVGGDAIDVEIQVDAGATGFYSSQSSTKVYRSASPASQTLHASVATGGVLIVAPDPLVCFAGAHFTQSQQFSLAAGANLILVDMLTAGRVAMGERWAFSHYESRISVQQDGQKILHDVLRLNPDEGVVVARLRRFNALATIVLSGPQLAEYGAKIQSALSAEPLQRNAELLCVASPLKNSGTLLRILGTSVEQVGRKVHACLDFVPKLLGDNPWSRKF